jgi:hypothetical protein
VIAAEAIKAPGSFRMLLALAAVATGLALQWDRGDYNEGALVVLTVAIAFAGAAVAQARIAAFERLPAWAAPAVLMAGLAVQVAMSFQVPPDFFAGTRAIRVLAPGLLVATVLLGAAARKRVSPLALLGPAFPAFLLAFMIGGFVEVAANAPPWIDNFYIQRDAGVALLKGVNPYTLTFPNIYPDERFYGPGVIKDGRFDFGYIYMPPALLAGLPGQILTGDFRYGFVVLVAIAALLVSRLGPLGPAAAVYMIFVPSMFNVLSWGWIEPVIFLAAAAFLWFARFAPDRSPILFGLLLSTKQYLVVLAPLALLLVPRPIDKAKLARMVGLAVAAGAVLTLPFVLWDVHAFYRSAVTLHVLQPIRLDSMSHYAYAARHWHYFVPAPVPFLVAGLATLVALRVAPRGPAGFAAASALAVMLFFTCSKQAFIHYYDFALALLCGALAVAPAWAPAPAAAPTPPLSEAPSPAP